MAGSPRTRGALERRADQEAFTKRVYMPVQDFIQTEWIGSALLLGAAIVALLWANSPFVDAYHHLLETPIVVDLGVFSISKDLHHWVNDGMMALFFFVVGLEIKRELLHGALASAKQAALPIAGALGGMVAPALIYFALNPTGEASAGWGIPMATDIAFALGILGLVGRGIPSAVRVFLLALAIVDDIGAILVIALFYTESLSVVALVWGAAVLVVIVFMQRMGVRSIPAYFFVGALFWVAILKSGVHATIAGVILGFMTPSRPYWGHETFAASAQSLLDRFRKALDRGDHSDAEATLGHLEELTEWSEAPLERLERAVHPWSAYLVLPVFALANAGVELSGESFSAALASTVTWGVAGGLIVGKIVGVLLFAFVAIRTGLAVMPEGVRWGHLTGSAMLAGVGFTVSLFITGLAFTDPAIVDQAKIGILGASLFAGVVGYLFLKLTSSGNDASGAEVA